MAKEIPQQLLSSLQNLQGFEEDAFVQTHQSGNQVVSIRINPAKFDIQQSSFDTAGKVPWSSNGFYLKQRPSFTLDPLFHAGAYYVQEASSMFLEEAIKQSCDISKPLRVLDLCAAPGGKSTLIQSIISDESLLVSNEVIKARANILAENLTKWGSANVIVTNNDPEHFKRLQGFFDLIVVDAPCSGSGLFRKDPDAIDEWSLANVALCSQRQQRILATIESSLKPGGILIYSTCSYSEQEDEDIADWLMEQFDFATFPLKKETSWGIIETTSKIKKAYGYRFYPDKVKGEGFYIAAFKKHGETPAYKDSRPNKKPALLSSREEAVVQDYIINPLKYSFIKWQDEVLAIPTGMLYDFLYLQSILYLKKGGVAIGTIIRNELVPHHDWAVSSLASAILPQVELTQELALDYLRRNDIKIDTHIKGWALVKFKEITLGLVKILPGRINNYYPREWRILNK